jgi:FolB domain-containing protein
MSYITIADLEVFYRVGLTDEERVKPQRLLLTVVLTYDFSSAAISGRLARTVDYNDVVHRLLKFGEKRQWKLMEAVVTDVADLVLANYPATQVAVEVKRPTVPEAKYISVSLSREKHAPETLKRSWWWWEWR